MYEWCVYSVFHFPIVAHVCVNCLYIHKQIECSYISNRCFPTRVKLSRRWSHAWMTRRGWSGERQSKLDLTGMCNMPTGIYQYMNIVLLQVYVGVSIAMSILYVHVCILQRMAMVL